MPDMRRYAVLLVLAALPWASLPAHAEDGPEGLLCNFQDASFVDGAQWHGVLYGGPMTGTGTLTCTIQVGSPTHGDTANDTVSASAEGSGVVVLPPTEVSFTAAHAEDIYVCAQFAPASGSTLYWDATDTWSTDPNVPCSQLYPPCECGPAYTFPDDLICPVFGTLRLVPEFADPNGPVYVAPDDDVYVAGTLVYDCEMTGSG